MPLDRGGRCTILRSDFTVVFCRDYRVAQIGDLARTEQSARENTGDKTPRHRLYGLAARSSALQQFSGARVPYLSRRGQVVGEAIVIRLCV